MAGTGEDYKPHRRVHSLLFRVQGLQFIILGFRHFHFYKSSILNISYKLQIVEPKWLLGIINLWMMTDLKP